MQILSKIRESRTGKGALALAAGLAFATSAASAQVSSYGDKQMGDPAGDHLPAVLTRATIVQKLNTQIPLDGQFIDETGKAVRMGDYFGRRPAILSLVYYNCPMLCSEELNGLVGALEMVKFRPGKDFDIIVASIDPSETPELAAKKKAFYIKRYGHPETANGWHFLTGQQPAINALADATGFGYVRVPGPDGKLTQFAHASSIELVTPDGKLSQYYLGVEYSPKDLRLGLVEASEHRIGSPVDAIMTYCYHYDPTLSRHSLIVARVVQLGCMITMLCLGGYMIVMFRRDRKSEKAMPVPNWKNVNG
ncbi:SCO family protein [Alloacidobacterium dinghuense]|uniref:SCO family protein n=1 Tax=Alloacidobacterium dinghuense TaxID=2763107 RepID=A0A7G8BFY7_9BACT|nr:SCO family protein [Alloacidobacterium dinghuense]QNI31457.1 SCO family protein [Alloacidobacterium dinghuense]